MNNTNYVGFKTEVEFLLPKGYLDGHGVLHRKGIMRLATAADEILPLRDPRVQQNPAYLAIIVLARVIIKLGEVQVIDTRTIEGLFAADLDYLQRTYESINSCEEATPTREASVEIHAANGGFNGLGRGFLAVGEA